MVKHIKGSSNTTADNLSRLPLCVGGAAAEYPDGQLRQLQQLPSVMSMDVVDMVQMLSQQPQIEVYGVTVYRVVGEPCREAWDILPLTIADVAKATRVDPVYGKLFNAVRSGNLDTTDKDLSKFNGTFSSLYIGDKVLYFGTRIVIPTRQQASLLGELHTTHIGASKMKETVRRYFWWPG